jgi:hypothetical protein
MWWSCRYLPLKNSQAPITQPFLEKAALIELLFYSSCSTAELSKVIKLCLPNITTTFNRQAVDLTAMCLESSFYPNTM